MYVFVLPDIQKQLCTKNGVSLLDVSEMFVSGVSSMYIYIMHYWNFLSCSIRNSTLVSLSRLFTIKVMLISLFTSFNFHSGL